MLLAASSASAALNTPEQVADINPGPASSTVVVPATVGRHLFFGAFDGSDGELWRSDGSRAGTAQIADINPGGGASMPGTVTALGDAAIFHAMEPLTGEELWRSDGTETTQLRDINPGVAPSNPRSFIQVGDQLLFRASNGSDGAELWRTDGTGAGTEMVEDIDGAATGSIGGFFDAGVLDGLAYFAASEAVAGRELYRSDGTAAGTEIVQNIALAGSSSPALITPVGDWIYLTADDGIVGRELWRSNGLPNGSGGVTELVDDIDGAATDSSVTGLTAFKERVYFAADGPGNGIELWRSDGTTTEIVKDINPVGDSEPGSLTVIGEQLFFIANDGANGREVWVSDGVPGGTTQMVADIDPAGSSPCGVPHLTALGPHLYLCADDGTTGSELWRTDGTEAGTQQFEINPVGPSAPSSFTVHDDTLYLTATDGVTGTELWGFDTASPRTEIADGPAEGETIREPQPRFELLSPRTVDLARFECRVDGEAFSTCAGLDGAVRTTGLSDGIHVFEARAVDVHENADPSPDTRSFRVDTEAKLKIVGRKLAHAGGNLRAKLRCPRSEANGPCRGKLKVQATSKGKRKQVLAKARFKIKAGKTKRVKLKPAVSRGRLARAVDAGDGRVRARAKVRDRLGNNGRARKTLRVSTGR